MDLKEARGHGGPRHPWELARADAVRSILKGTLRDGLKVLDLGCGDGFLSRELFAGMDVSVSAVDSNFTDTDLAGLAARGGNITYRRKLEGEGRFDLILLLDVLEHVEDDFGLLSELAQKRLSAGGRVLVSAPSFNALFTGHDEFLGHMRRYEPGELKALACRAGLDVISSGYLFGSLLLPRAIEAAFGALVKGREKGGAGMWKGSKAVTSIVKAALDLDNTLLLALNRGAGIRLPGLTGWVLCERRP